MRARAAIAADWRLDGGYGHWLCAGRVRLGRRALRGEANAVRKIKVGGCAKCGGSLMASRYEGEAYCCVNCGFVVYEERKPLHIPQRLKGALEKGGRPRKEREIDGGLRRLRRRCGYASGGDGEMWLCLCGLSFVSRPALGAHVLQYRRDRDRGITEAM